MADEHAALHAVSGLQASIAQILRVLETDAYDQAQLDHLVAQLQAMEHQLAAAVPESPPPPA